MTCRAALTFLTSFGIIVSLSAGALRAQAAGPDANSPAAAPASGATDANAPAARAAAPTIRPAGAPDGETRVASPCKNEANASPAIGQSLSARFLRRRKEGFLSDSSPAGHLGAFSASPRTKASKGGIHGTNRLMGC